MMKFSLFSLISVLIITGNVIAQDTLKVKKKPRTEVFTVVEEMAEFPGGMQEMRNFIRINIVFPEIVRADPKFEGCKVFLKFIIDESGDLVEPEVLKGCSYKECDEEALRVIKLMPKWKPARMTGRNVCSYFNLPVSFKLTAQKGSQ